MAHADVKFAYHRVYSATKLAMAARFEARRGQLAFCAAGSEPVPAPAVIPAGIMLSPKAPQALLIFGPAAGVNVDVVLTPSSTSVRSMMRCVLSTTPPARLPPGTGCCMAHASEVAAPPPDAVSVPFMSCVPNQPCAPFSRTL